MRPTGAAETVVSAFSHRFSPTNLTKCSKRSLERTLRAVPCGADTEEGNIRRVGGKSQKSHTYSDPKVPPSQSVKK